MSGNSAYGPTGCEVATNFDTCIQNAGGSLDPKGWVACSQLQGNIAQYNECVYNGYKSIVTCFSSFCNQDTTNTVSTMKAALDQYTGYVQQSQQPTTQQQTTQQQPANQQQTTQQQTTQQQPNAQQQTTGQQTNAQQQTAGQQTTGNGINNANTANPNTINDASGAVSNKVSKILVSFLVVSGLLMNFL
ncbi:hypothetical protein H8356DRAFT_1326712 [Neocallimastix lanati (nom. inval.)]|nr:hypothetical protein H8356DRAFT_1326712 [Neocallimastix sp. JGI-2020a]